MYNIYSYEKKIKQDEEEAKRKIKEKKIEDMRKKILPELAENYQKRIKKFIFEMAKHPILIKECKQETNTTRQEFMNDNNRKFGGSRKFTFRKYQTDKERIEDFLRQKELNEKKTIKPKSSSLTTKILKTEENKTHHSVEQPIMRFKPRTDLERLYYTINEYSFGKVSKEVVDEQLKNLNLNEVKKSEDEENTDFAFLEKFENIDERAFEEMQTQKEFLNKQGYNEKNSETVKQLTLIIEHYNKKHIANEDDPSRYATKQAWRSHVNKKAAKKLLGEYNKKTHFKAASVFSQHLDEYKSKQSNKSVKRLPLPRLQKDFLNFNCLDEPCNDEENNEDYNGSDWFGGDRNNNNNNNGSESHRCRRTKKLEFSGSKESVNYMSEFYNKTASNFRKMDDDVFTKSDEKKNKINNDDYFGNSQHKEAFGGFVPPRTGINFNPLRKRNVEPYDPKSLNYLKKIAESNNVTETSAEKQNSSVGKNFGFLSNLKKNAVSHKNDILNGYKFLNREISLYDDEERITIDNETYLKTQVDLISKKILKKCNFTNTKSDFNNKSLKAGTGKLMITSGLTVNDFTKKFNIPK